MLTTPQLEHIANGARSLRGKIAVGLESPFATIWLSERERATQSDLLAASHHLALATAHLHRAAERARPLIEGTVI